MPGRRTKDSRHGEVVKGYLLNRMPWADGYKIAWPLTLNTDKKMVNAKMVDIQMLQGIYYRSALDANVAILRMINSVRSRGQEGKR